MHFRKIARRWSLRSTNTFSKGKRGIPSPRNKMDNTTKLSKTDSYECLTETANYRREWLYFFRNPVTEDLR